MQKVREHKKKYQSNNFHLFLPLTIHTTPVSFLLSVFINLLTSLFGVEGRVSPREADPEPEPPAVEEDPGMA